MARKDKKKDSTSKKVAKTAGVAYGVKKVLGGLTKLALVAGIGAAIVKVMRRDSTAPQAT